MQRVNINVMGFDLTREVPSTIEEYNSLAPKRVNPVLEDANFNVLYRGTFPEIRDGLCEILEKSYGIARAEDEKDGVYIKRAIATIMKDSGRTEAALRAEITPKLQDVADKASFPVQAAERKASDGPAIGKRDLQNAEQMFKDGKAAAVASKLGTLLGREVNVTTGDAVADTKTLARALADYRRQLAQQAEAALTA